MRLSDLDDRASVYAAFNARWISEEDVARTFVPSSSFRKLLHPNNALLMGPRGCGKTTALKMLTRRAVSQWKLFSATKDLPLPSFETVYVPLDVKFSAELKFAEQAAGGDQKLATSLQRAFVNLTVFVSILEVYSLLVDESDPLHHALSERLISLLKQARRPARLRDVREGLLSWSDRLQRLINTAGSEDIRSYLEGLPDLLFVPVYEPVIRLGRLFNEMRPDDPVVHWCLAFDELEIGPVWLQEELLDALRSVHQSLYLKLTWAPTLPEHVRSMTPPRPKADYEIVRMWHSHAEDSRKFSRALMKRMISAKLGDSIGPTEVFGRSEFAAEDGDSYGPGGVFYKRLRDLSRRDVSLRDFLKENGVNPSHPTSQEAGIRNRILRKIKPVVILRDERLKRGGLRSRKTLPIYSGEDVISLMSDGNPRWLSLLVSELLDHLDPSTPLGSCPLIPKEQQGRILRSISRRMLSWMRASPRPASGPRVQPSLSLEELIGALGQFFQNELVAPAFPVDPLGSFKVDPKVPESFRSELQRGVIEGAFLFVGGSELDVIEKLDGARLRLSFMFSPLYTLLLRNNRVINLSSILERATDLDTQAGLFDEDLENGGE